MRFDIQKNTAGTDMSSGSRKEPLNPGGNISPLPRSDFYSNENQD